MTRRHFLRTTALATTAAALAPRRALAQPAARQRPIQNPQSKIQNPNILLIMADDLNHWIGPIGRNPQTRTPNLDRFAKQAVNFTHAYCPASVCNPSRCAFMSGLHPSTTGVYGNPNLPWQNYIDEKKALNGYLRANGYHAIGAGKIYHIGGNGSAPHSEGIQWDEYSTHVFGDDPGEDGSGNAGVPPADEGRPDPRPKRNNAPSSSAPRTKPTRFADIALGPLNITDADTNDQKVAKWIGSQLQKTYTKPFFMAYGCHKPHLPWQVPQKWFDLFPLADIQLPPTQPTDSDDLPPTGKRWTHDARWKAINAPGGDQAIKNWKLAIQAYLASIAYTDAQFGIILDALDRSPHRDNTIVLVMADHGWHLGEKQHFGKTTLWEESTRVPYLWRVPNLTPVNGATCTRAVETLSLFPTLCDLTGLPKPAYLEGASIAPLLANPTAEWTRPALTTYGYKNHALRTEQWRYIRYADGGEELYDELADPNEWRNLAADPKHAPLKKDLAKWFPSENAPDKAKSAGAAAGKSRRKA